MSYANEGSQKNAIKNWHKHSYTDVETKARLIMQCIGQFKETTNSSVKSSVCPPEGKILHNCLRKHQFGCEISKETRILLRKIMLESDNYKIQQDLDNFYNPEFQMVKACYIQKLEQMKKNRAATRLGKSSYQYQQSADECL